LGLLMLAVAWSDSHRFVVPDVLSGPAFALGVVNGVVTSPEGELAGGLSALSRAGLTAGLFFMLAGRLLLLLWFAVTLVPDARADPRAKAARPYALVGYPRSARSLLVRAEQGDPRAQNYS
jgi:hypothetical protein